jgi:chorismate mutase/prephenate dehydratase
MKSDKGLFQAHPDDRIDSEGPHPRIEDLRTAIDDIDAKLLELINRRMTLVRDIGHIKKDKGNQVLDKKRENQIMQRLSQLNQGPLSDTVLHHVFSIIIAASRQLQSPQHVSYLGPEATFTHMAALRYFGISADFLSRSSIHEIFEDVEKHISHYGVVPVENSIEGVVNHTLDLFFESHLKICAEIFQPISHDLLSQTGRMEDIDIVYSHPQAYAQCRKWFQKHLPDVTFRECSSTAEAARRVCSEKHAAAIAGSEAAEFYQLQRVAVKIEDFHHNTTRFLVLGHEDVLPSGNDITSVLFVTPHIPGALFKVLEPLAKAGINMLKLESRPTKFENWSYFFMMDIAGHIHDPNIKETLEQLKPLCLFLKFLGSYPKG